MVRENYPISGATFKENPALFGVPKTDTDLGNKVIKKRLDSILGATKKLDAAIPKPLDEIGDWPGEVGHAAMALAEVLVTALDLVRKVEPIPVAAVQASEWAAGVLREAAGQAIVKPKKSTVKGETRAKIIAALTKHHDYQNGSCLNWKPIGVNELTRLAGAKSSSSASDFFNSQYGEGDGKKKKNGHLRYRRICCRNHSLLIETLRALNGETTSSHIAGYGRNPPGEGSREDDE
ncbi:MAG: hypothetical protein L6306_11645 [Planctomycetales bacterium]|nr:hypothetical protein [Planctomycetales bacterium]